VIKILLTHKWMQWRAYACLVAVGVDVKLKKTIRKCQIAVYQI
jgi:hypothetical protein